MRLTSLATALASFASLTCAAGGQVTGLSCVDWAATINGEGFRVKDVYIDCATETTRLLAVFNTTILLSAKPGAVFVQAPLPGVVGTSRPVCAEIEWSPLWEIDTYLALGGEQCESADGFWFTPDFPADALANSGGISVPGGWFLVPPYYGCQTAGPDLRVRVLRVAIRESDWIPGAWLTVAWTVGWKQLVPNSGANFADVATFFPWPGNPGAGPEEDVPGMEGPPDGIPGGGGGWSGGSAVPEAAVAPLLGRTNYWRSGNGFVIGWRIEGTAFDSALAWSQPIPPQQQPVGHGDFDGDGDDDFLLRTDDNGGLWMWESDEGELIDASFLGLPPTPEPYQWSVVALADVTGDGGKEIIWRRASGSGGTVRAWKVADGAVVGNVQMGTSPGFELLGLGDFNGDGRDDFLWRLFNGAIMAWRTNANLSTTPVMFGNAPWLPPVWKVGAILDLNGDGTDDVLWHNTQTGQVNAWLVQNFARASGGIVSNSVPSWWSVIGTADLNQDGKADLIWRNGLTGQVNAWCMSGVQKIEGAPVGPAPLSWTPF